jgi:hypothetical protein
VQVLHPTKVQQQQNPLIKNTYILINKRKNKKYARSKFHEEDVNYPSKSIGIYK